MKNPNKMPIPSFKGSDYNDLALIAAIKRNDQRACTKLFKKYTQVLTKRYFRNFKSQEDLKDVIIEIMAKVFENVDKYKVDYTFNAWVSALAKNYIVDHFRAKKSSVSDLNSMSMDAVVDSSTGETIQFELPCSEPEVMTAKPEVERQAKLEYVYDVIDQLPEIALNEFPQDMRDLFVFHNDLKAVNSSHKEVLSIISKETGMKFKEVEKNINTVKKRCAQAELEKRIMIMYLRDNMPYETIRKKFNMELDLLKVTIWRAKSKIIKSINVRKMVMEVSSKYAIEQLRKEGFINEKQISNSLVRVR